MMVENVGGVDSVSVGVLEVVPFRPRAKAAVAMSSPQISDTGRMENGAWSMEHGAWSMKGQGRDSPAFALMMGW